MNRVDKAIILAAGIGKRMRPLTLDIPKPLIRVNGIRMIDTLIHGLRKNGIDKIYVVVGYKKEQFCYLKSEFNGIVLIDNPYYNISNNISSLYVAREYLQNSIILDGDQLIYNSDVLSPCFERSGYNAVWREQCSGEWLMTVENGVVTHCSKTGGKQGWQLYSISRWNIEDGHRLCRHLEIEFEDKKNRQIYWDDIVMFNYAKEYKLGIRQMRTDDVIEIDGLDELIAIDASYECMLGEG